MYDLSKVILSVTTLLQDVNRVSRYAILVACCMIPEVQDKILEAWNALKTVSIMAKNLAQFQSLL